MKATDTKTAEEILFFEVNEAYLDEVGIKDNVLRAMEAYAFQFKAERPSVTDEPLPEQTESAEVHNPDWGRFFRETNEASQPSEVSDKPSDTLQEFIEDVQYMQGLYKKDRYTQAEEWKKKLSERLDDIMREGK